VPAHLAVLGLLLRALFVTITVTVSRTVTVTVTVSQRRDRADRPELVGAGGLQAMASRNHGTERTTIAAKNFSGESTICDMGKGSVSICLVVV
jgi:hypothetical protein